jgi:D-psicose/D-tagatose/L-ribulose 3-epimerase
MRIGISNLAWEINEDEAISALLQKYSVGAIDVVPTKYFPDLEKVTTENMKRIRDWWKDRGVEITGMQSLLFGTNNLNIFGDHETQEKMLKHLTQICRVGAGLGATRLVFGSPKCRNREGLTNAEAQAKALPFFTRLGKIAQDQGVFICLEPNPVGYSCNFMTTAQETAEIVRQVGLDSVRMQWDSGAITMNAESPTQVAEKFHTLIGHIHASEPHLVTLGEGGVAHKSMAAALFPFFNHKRSYLVTIEMVASKTEPHVTAVEKALQVALANYK